jgi:hypothetical protein
MSERADLLAELVRSGPLSQHDLASLGSYGWDSEETLVTLTKADACAVLHRHVLGELSDEDLARWADQIEARDDIGFEVEHEGALKRFIFELANPAINEPTSEAASRWREALT